MMRSMTLNKLCTAFLFLMATFLSYADESVITILNDDYLQKKKEFENKVSECMKIRNVVEIADDQVGYLRKIGIYHSGILKAIGYFSGRNRTLCSKNEQINFYLSTGILKTAKEKYEQPYEDEENTQFLTLYSDVGDAESFIEYSKFPQEAKDYFEKIFGEKPFDFLKAVKSVDKYREKK